MAIKLVHDPLATSTTSSGSTSTVDAYTKTETDTLLAKKAESSHTHVVADITDLDLSNIGSAGSSTVTAHTHTFADVTGLQTLADQVASLQTAVDAANTTLEELV